MERRSPSWSASSKDLPGVQWLRLRGFETGRTSLEQIDALAEEAEAEVAAIAARMMLQRDSPEVCCMLSFFDLGEGNGIFFYNNDVIRCCVLIFSQLFLFDAGSSEEGGAGVCPPSPDDGEEGEGDADRAGESTTARDYLTCPAFWFWSGVAFTVLFGLSFQFLLATCSAGLQFYDDHTYQRLAERHHKHPGLP